MSIMMKRKSVREFKDDSIPEEIITKLLASAMQAPSAKNQQPWEFIVVDDKNLLNQLSTMHVGSWPLKSSPLAIIPMLKVSDKSPHMTVQDVAAATENILLEAVNQGLGGVWIGVYPLEERLNHVCEIFDIKGSTKPFCILALGYPLKESIVKIRYDESRIHRNKWSD